MNTCRSACSWTFTTYAVCRGSRADRRLLLLRSLACLCVLLLLWSHVTEAQQMKLLARGTGWFFDYHSKLYWTRDDGAHWTDITPDATRPLHRVDEPASVRNAPIISATSAGPNRRKGELQGVFFRNTAEGWAVLGVGQDEGFADYQIAHTVNSAITGQ